MCFIVRVGCVERWVKSSFELICGCGLCSGAWAVERGEGAVRRVRV